MWLNTYGVAYSPRHRGDVQQQLHLLGVHRLWRTPGRTLLEGKAGLAPRPPLNFKLRLPAVGERLTEYLFPYNPFRCLPGLMAAEVGRLEVDGFGTSSMPGLACCEQLNQVGVMAPSALLDSPAET